MLAGFGIRPELFEAVFEMQPRVGFLEAHSENYFGESIARAKLVELREQYPISLHGVGLSLGRADDLNQYHLDQLKQLIVEIDPIFVSEHMSWSAYSHTHLPDLLPLPLNQQSLVVMCEHIEQMQEALNCQILVENPSNYLLFDQLQIPEPEFLNTLAERTGCGLLVDVNNIHVSAMNCQRDAIEYIDQLNSNAVKQYHLAGYTEVERENESVLIDTHNHTVFPPVWNLFKHTVNQHGKKPTLVEWDSDFPDLSVLLEECTKADEILNSTGKASARFSNIKPDTKAFTNPKQTLENHQQVFLSNILNLSENIPQAIEAHQHRIWIYQNNVFGATREYLQAVYPALEGVVGADFFKQMTQVFIQEWPPEEGNIHQYGQKFYQVLDHFDALSSMPYLADLISYEWALHAAYYSVTNGILDPTKINQEKLLSTPVEYNSSVTLLEFDYPIYQIHLQSMPDYAGAVSIDLSQSKDCMLVYKQQQAVKTRLLKPEEVLFFVCLQKSETLLQAIEALHGSLSEQDLSTNLALVFELGILSEISTK